MQAECPAGRLYSCLVHLIIESERSGEPNLTAIEARPNASSRPKNRQEDRQTSPRPFLVLVLFLSHPHRSLVLRSRVASLQVARSSLRQHLPPAAGVDSSEYQVLPAVSVSVCVHEGRSPPPQSDPAVHLVASIRVQPVSTNSVGVRQSSLTTIHSSNGLLRDAQSPSQRWWSAKSLSLASSPGCSPLLCVSHRPFPRTRTLHRSTTHQEPKSVADKSYH